MGDHEEEQKLQARLRDHPALTARELVVEMGRTGGVVITYRGHTRGIWRVHNGQFLFRQSGYSIATQRAASVEEAVRITLSVV